MNDEEEEVDLIDEFDVNVEDKGEINAPNSLSQSSSLYPILSAPQESIYAFKENDESRVFAHQESLTSRQLYPTFDKAEEAHEILKKPSNYPIIHNPRAVALAATPPAFSDPISQSSASPQHAVQPPTMWIPRGKQSLRYPSSTNHLPMSASSIKTNQTSAIEYKEKAASKQTHREQDQPIQGQVPLEEEQKESGVMTLNELKTKQHEIEKEIEGYERRFDYLANALAGKTPHQQEERFKREKQRQERDQRRHLALEKRIQQQLERDQKRQRIHQQHSQHDHKHKHEHEHAHEQIKQEEEEEEEDVNF
jgi:hypothetical protein